MARPMGRHHCAVIIVALVSFLLLPSLTGAAVIGVPPLANLTGDARLNWVGEGIAATLVEKLGRVSEFLCVPYTVRGLPLGKEGVEIPVLLKANERLPADYVLLGAVVTAGDDTHPDAPLSVTVRIVDVRSLRQILTVELAGAMKQLFGIESDLSFAVIKALGVELTSAEADFLKTHETSSLRAYKETTLGSLFLDEGRFGEAIAMFEEAARHHPGIYYPRNNHLLTEAYLRSGKKREMLEQLRKDAATLSSAFFDLAVAQEFDGQLDKAAENLRLFLRYTDRRSLLWNRWVPGPSLVGVTADRVFVRGADGLVMAIRIDSGSETADAAPAPAVPLPTVEETRHLRSLIPPREAGLVTAGPVRAGTRFYYGLSNGCVVGRSVDTGSRFWTYRLRDIPREMIPAGDRLLVLDSRDVVRCLGVFETAQPSDVQAYLKLAEISLRKGNGEEARSIYQFIVDDVNPGSRESWLALGEMSRKAGDQDAASEYLQRSREVAD